MFLWGALSDEGTSSVQLILWPTVSRPIRLCVRHPFGAHDQIFPFPFFYRSLALLFVLVRPLWREDGTIICSAICQWSESRRTHNHTLLSHLRLLDSISVTSYDSQRLRWRYSNPPPHEERERVEVEVTLQLTVRQSACQSIEPTLGLATRYYFLSEVCFLNIAVLSLWPAFSDERSSLSFVILSL
jgi:hypothetical protein